MADETVIEPSTPAALDSPTRCDVCGYRDWDNESRDKCSRCGHLHADIRVRDVTAVAPAPVVDVVRPVVAGPIMPPAWATSVPSAAIAPAPVSES